MGYSIMIPFETEEEKNRMKEFLNKNFRPLKEILSDLSLKSIELSEGFPPHDEISYIGEVKEPILGYDYGAGETDIERDYFYEICYWMAVHGGKRENGRPIFIYDGYERWNVFINEPADKSSDWVEVNEYGYRKISSLKQMEHFSKVAQITLHGMKKQLEKVDSAIHDELKRLSELWKRER